MERDAHIRRLSEYIFQGPQWRSSPPQGPLHGASSEREPHHQSLLHPSLEVPGRRQQQAASSAHYTTSCKHSLVLLRMGEIIARNMLSWLWLLIKLLLLHLVACLYYCISDARSHKHQSKWLVMWYKLQRAYYYVTTFGSLHDVYRTHTHILHMTLCPFIHQQISSKTGGRISLRDYFKAKLVQQIGGRHRSLYSSWCRPVYGE